MDRCGHTKICLANVSMPPHAMCNQKVLEVKATDVRYT